MKPNNQWRHWWQFTVAVGLKWLDGLAVNNEWGASWLISEVVSSPDTQLAFQWGCRHRWHRGDEQACTSCPAGRDGREDVWEAQTWERWRKSWAAERSGEVRWRGEESRHPSVKKTPRGWQSGLFCTWRRRANDEENKNIKQQKRGHNDASILTAPAAGVSSSSSLSVTAFVPPLPHLHHHQPLMFAHRITLISALESSSVSAHREVQPEKTWRRRRGCDADCKRFGSTVVHTSFMSRFSCALVCGSWWVGMKTAPSTLKAAKPSTLYLICFLSSSPSRFFSPRVSIYVSDEDDYKSSQ